MKKMIVLREDHLFVKNGEVFNFFILINLQMGQLYRQYFQRNLFKIYLLLITHLII